MIDIVLAAILASASGGTVTACSTEENFTFDHLLDVCDPLIDGRKAYSATFSASLTPQPAAQQVTLYEGDRGWIMHVAGFKWVRGGPITTRRHEISISSNDVQTLISRLDEDTMERLSKLSYYGGPLVICSDGAKTEIAMAGDSKRRSFSQHSCAGKSELHEIAASFRALALKYDPEFEGMLDGLHK